LARISVLEPRGVEVDEDMALRPNSWVVVVEGRTAQRRSSDGCTKADNTTISFQIQSKIEGFPPMKYSDMPAHLPEIFRYSN